MEEDCKLNDVINNDDIENVTKKQKTRERLNFKVESTSNWKYEKIKQLNVSFNDTLPTDINDDILKNVPVIINELLNNDIYKSYVDNMTEKVFKKYLLSIKDKDIRNLIASLSKILSNQNYPETIVDSFVKDLLTMIGFDTSIKLLDISINLPLDLTISKITVESKPDVTVGPLGKKQIMFLVCEDKTQQNKTDYPQSQVIGEVIAAYQQIIELYDKETANAFINRYKFPFMTVHGSRFVFYKMNNMSSKFLDDLKKGYKPDEPLIIDRYAFDVPDKFRPVGFNFDRYDQRKIIIKMLMYFRNIVFSELEIYEQ